MFMCKFIGVGLAA